jgi:hypothetical protein
VVITLKVNGLIRETNSESAWLSQKPDDDGLLIG